MATAQPYAPPRTDWGAPQLQGRWTNASLTTLERPDALPTVVLTEAQAQAYEAAHPRRPFIPNDLVGQGETEIWELTSGLARVGGEPRASWIVDPADGRLPFSEEGRQKLRRTIGADDPEERTLGDRCLTDKAGPPMLNGNYNNRWLLVQTRDYLVIQMEHGGEVRIIRITNSGHLPAAVSQWKGDSIARWDGDTLMIETTNFHERQGWRRHALWHYYLSAGAIVTETLKRTSADDLLYTFTVSDPATYTQTWRGEMPLRTTKERMYEYACHEGNYSLGNILAGARVQAERKVRAPQ